MTSGAIDIFCFAIDSLCFAIDILCFAIDILCFYFLSWHLMLLIFSAFYAPKRMYLRWSARVAQFLFNQSCQFSPFWLLAERYNGEEWFTIYIASCTLWGYIINSYYTIIITIISYYNNYSNWLSQREHNWHTFWAVCSLLLNTSS